MPEWKMEVPKKIKPERLEQIASLLNTSLDQLKEFDSEKILPNNTITFKQNNHNKKNVKQIIAPLSCYKIDPDLEELYKKQIAVLEKLVAELESKNTHLEMQLKTYKSTMNGQK